MASAIRNMAAIAASITARMEPSSAFTRLHNQEKPIQLHHSSPISSRPRMTPCQVSSWAISAVIWVSAKTKTRSKKSSSVVTDWSSDVACALIGVLRVLMALIVSDEAVIGRR